MTAITDGAILSVLVAAGLVSDSVIISAGIIKAAKAKTNGAVKRAWENIGNGVFVLACSLLEVKSSLKAAAKAGVKAAEETEKLNIFQTAV